MPLELSIVGEETTDHIIYQVKLGCNLPGNVLRTYIHQSKKLHGIPLSLNHKCNVDEIRSKFKTDIIRLCQKYVTPEKQFVAVNNTTLADLLKEEGIKVLNVASPFNAEVPKLDALDSEFGSKFLCSIHDQNVVAHYRCSQRKASHYYLWLTSKN